MTSKWEVRINNYVFAFNCFYSYDLNAIISLSLELHTRLDVVYALEHLRWNFLNEFRVVFAITFSSRNSNSEFFTYSFA
ncbi:hypothetical protein D3C71_1931830 [compost metagenome]